MLKAVSEVGLLVCCGALLACGAETSAGGASPAATPRAAAAVDRAPATRPDGMPWSAVPKLLQDAVGRPVILAAEADEELVAASGCTAMVRSGGSFVRARIDDFLLHASYRGRAEVAGEPEGPVVTGCAATWAPRRSAWRKSIACDGGYAPSQSLRAVTVSGGGMRYCRLRGRWLRALWIVPPRGSRWLVVARKRYSVAYSARERFPVRVTFIASPKTKVLARGRFKYTSVTARGRARHHTTFGYVAG